MSTGLAFITPPFDRADILSYRHEQPAGSNLLDREEATPGDHAAMEPRGVDPEVTLRAFLKAGVPV